MVYSDKKSEKSEIDLIKSHKKSPRVRKSEKLARNNRVLNGGDKILTKCATFLMLKVLAMSVLEI